MWRTGASRLSVLRAAVLKSQPSWGHVPLVRQALAADAPSVRKSVAGSEQLVTCRSWHCARDAAWHPRSWCAGTSGLGFCADGGRALGGKGGEGVVLAGLQHLKGMQLRHIMIDVKDNNVEVALRKWKRKMREEGLLSLYRDQRYCIKPAEQRVLDRKARDLRMAKREFRFKLKWIMNRRSRGF